MGATDFPWMSALALLYPISATIYLAAETPTPPIMIAGYGIADLGYLLCGAAMFSGTFLVFGLKKRWQVLILAALCIVIGVLLTSLGLPKPSQ